MSQNAMMERHNDTFLIDGFPRSVEQAEVHHHHILNCPATVVSNLRLNTVRMLGRNATPCPRDRHAHKGAWCAQEFERRIKPPTAVLFYDCPEDVMMVRRGGQRPGGCLCGPVLNARNSCPLLSRHVCSAGARAGARQVRRQGRRQRRDGHQTHQNVGSVLQRLFTRNHGRCSCRPGSCIVRWSDEAHKCMQVQGPDSASEAAVPAQGPLRHHLGGSGGSRGLSQHAAGVQLSELQRACRPMRDDLPVLRRPVPSIADEPSGSHVSHTMCCTGISPEQRMLETAQALSHFVPGKPSKAERRRSLALAAQEQLAQRQQVTAPIHFKFESGQGNALLHALQHPVTSMPKHVLCCASCQRHKRRLPGNCPCVMQRCRVAFAGSPAAGVKRSGVGMSSTAGPIQQQRTKLPVSSASRQWH